MKGLTSSVIVFLFLSLASPSMATMVTTSIAVTLPTNLQTVDGYALGPYAGGDVITFTATYDDAGTAYHVWYDWTNKIAEFGGGDDKIEQTYTNIPSLAIMSDATITVSGLAPLPVNPPYYSAPDNDHFIVDNYSYLYETVSDQIQIAFQNNSDQYQLFLNNDGAGYISIQQWFDYRYPSEQYVFSANFAPGAAQITTSTPVPEPSTMLLLASGLVGLAGFRRQFRKN